MTEDKEDKIDTETLLKFGLGLLLGYYLSKLPDKIIGYKPENKEK